MRGPLDGEAFLRSGRPIATSTLPKMLQHHEIAAVPHGFRSSFRDWAAEETDHPREVIEAALAHVVQNKVDGVDASSRRHRNVPRWRCRDIPPEGGGIQWKTLPSSASIWRSAVFSSTAHGQTDRLRSARS